MDSTRLNPIACANPPPVTLSPIMLDRNCKQILELTTREIQKNIQKIILDGKKKSPRIQKNPPVRPDQSYFGKDEEYVMKNLKDKLPQFFCSNSSDESRSYCESLCEFSRLIARETVNKNNNRMGLMLRDTSEGSCDIPDTLHAMIALIGYITNCVHTSSTNHSQEEDQDLHEHRGLVMYTIRKAKAPPSVVNGRSLINNLIEKAKQEIKPDNKIVTTLKNVEEIHKALFKVLLKKVAHV
ncbi:unnamed protein product [Pleuronectes platessa]|uniref:Uncharacterized protein n=1 Tax=Pleuronectes platessa TaxID=8262 RepID=A0A9N7Z4K2_PLEPL|nr:unnamed protein product [Pleuronectes platessa]